MTEARTDEIRRYIEDHGDDPISTRNVVQLVVDMPTDELFRALARWVASAAEPQLRERVVTLETRIGRQVHRATVQLLGVDEHQAGVRPLSQGTLDMARGLGPRTRQPARRRPPTPSTDHGPVVRTTRRSAQPSRLTWRCLG